MATLSAFLIVCALSVAAVAGARPNILFLMADQMRWDTLGPDRAYGQTLPNLEWLASSGAYFKNTYSTTPTCTPARSALLTGLSPWYHGMLGYGDIAPRYTFEWPRTLSDSGYHTAAIGKNHFLWNTSSDNGFAHGFEELLLYDGLGDGLHNNSANEFDQYDQWFQTKMPGADPHATKGSDGQALDWNSWAGSPLGYLYEESLHPTAWVGANAVSFLQEYASEAPFALKVSFHRPHSPYDPPKRVLDGTPSSLLPPIHRGNSSSDWDVIYANSHAPCGPSDPDAWCGDMPDDNVTLSRRAYYASLRFVDEWIGNIIQTLNTTGLINNTFILFCSDHGDGQGDHHLWRKSYPFELSTHVPALAWWPTSWPAAVPRGTVLDSLVELRDVASTFLDVAGVTVPQDVTLNGTSLACLLRSAGGAGTGCGPQGGPWRDWLDLEHDICFNNSNHWNGGVDSSTKYVYFAPLGTELLFDLSVDPYEMTDVSREPAYAGAMAMWRGRLVAQYEAEGRGDTWVSKGALVPRPLGQLYSPNYPSPSSVGGDTLAQPPSSVAANAAIAA